MYHSLPQFNMCKITTRRITQQKVSHAIDTELNTKTYCNTECRITYSGKNTCAHTGSPDLQRCILQTLWAEWDPVGGEYHGHYQHPNLDMNKHLLVQASKSEEASGLKNHNDSQYFHIFVCIYIYILVAWWPSPPSTITPSTCWSGHRNLHWAPQVFGSNGSSRQRPNGKTPLSTSPSYWW